MCVYVCVCVQYDGSVGGAHAFLNWKHDTPAVMIYYLAWEVFGAASAAFERRGETEREPPLFSPGSITATVGEALNTLNCMPRLLIHKVEHFSSGL